jgi:uncharacterized protein (DUF1501 family)
MTMASRRDLLRGLLALSALPALPRLSLASPLTDRRLVVVLLRGGLDGLALLPPHGDPDYAARGRAALPMPGEPDGILDLDGFFGLHPAMADLMPLAAAGELLGVHAVGLPGTERSHFEAQDMLESGGAHPRALKTGWLGRALGTLPGAGDAPQAVSIGQGVPLILRGPAAVTAISSTDTVLEDEPFLDMVSAMYADDPQLSEALAQSMMARALLADMDGGDRGGRRRQARSTGQLLARPDGPRVAVLEVGGMDTHAAQASALRTRLGQLTDGILALKEGLGDAWGSSVVVLITEFGRTVAGNGTGGTDHGTGSAALLLGGAVAGGRVVGSWRGLQSLHDGRDLAVTTDLRAVLSGVLRDHLGISDDTIFPDGPPPLGGLIRST